MDEKVKKEKRALQSIFSEFYSHELVKEYFESLKEASINDLSKQKGEELYRAQGAYMLLEQLLTAFQLKEKQEKIAKKNAVLDKLSNS